MVSLPQYDSDKRAMFPCRAITTATVRMTRQFTAQGLGICCKARRDSPVRNLESFPTNPFPKPIFLKRSEPLAIAGGLFAELNRLLPQTVLIRKKSRKSLKTFGIFDF